MVTVKINILLVAILFVFVSCTRKQIKNIQDVNCMPIPQHATEEYDTFRTFDEYKMAGVGCSSKDSIQVYVKSVGDTIYVKKSNCGDSATIYIKKGNWWENKTYYHTDATEIDKNGSNIPQRYDRYIKEDTIIEQQTDYYPNQVSHRYYLKTRNKVIVINSEFDIFADKKGVFNPDLVSCKYKELPDLNKENRFSFRKKGYYTLKKTIEENHMIFICELEDEIVKKSILMNSLEEFDIKPGLRIEVSNIKKKETIGLIRQDYHINAKSELSAMIQKEIKKRKIYSRKGKYTVVLKLKISPKGKVIDAESVREPSAKELVVAAKSIAFWLADSGVIKRNVKLGTEYIYVPFEFESKK